MLDMPSSDGGSERPQRTRTKPARFRRQDDDDDDDQGHAPSTRDNQPPANLAVSKASTPPSANSAVSKASESTNKRAPSKQGSYQEFQGPQVDHQEEGQESPACVCLSLRCSIGLSLRSLSAVSS